MVTLVESFGWLVILCAGIGYGLVGIGTHRREDFPGKASFVASCLLVGGLLVALTALLAITRLDVQSPLVAASGFVVLFLAFATGLIAPLAWLRFTLRFTGQRIPTDRRTFLYIGLPVLVALGTVAVFTAIPLLGFAAGGPLIPGRYVPLVEGALEYVTAVTAFYLASLLVAGASLVGWTGYTYRHLSTRGGALLGVGVVLPWVAIVMPEVAEFFRDQPVLITYHMAIGAAVGLAAMGGAVYRHGLFEDVPAAGTIGREVTVEEMTDPVIVVDADGRILDLNAAAERAFGASEGTIGAPLGALFDGALDPDDIFGDSGGRAGLTIGGRTYEATPSDLEDEYGRTLGHSVVFHDVTDRERREQRIQVLNRVLRHNLRNDMNAVNGYAELLAEESPDPENYAVRIQETASGLLAIGEKARELEAVIADQRDQRTAPLADVLDRVIEEVREAYPDCSIRVDVASPAGDVHVVESVVTSVLRELIENGIEHNDTEGPRIEVEATLDRSRDHPLVITVADNGPGIPDHELAPIREGSESALEHGSGLGLWLVEWGVARLDGTVAFGENDPRGTVATLRLPGSA